MKINKLLAVTIGLSFGLLSGCATIISGTTQSVNVQAIDAQTHAILPDVACTVTDGQGDTYPVPSNPGTIVVTKGRGALQFSCVKPGYKQTQVGAGESFSKWTLVNVLFWPGFLVDAATGAIQKYPSHFTVIMTAKSGRHHKYHRA